MHLKIKFATKKHSGCNWFFVQQDWDEINWSQHYLKIFLVINTKKEAC